MSLHVNTFNNSSVDAPALPNAQTPAIDDAPSVTPLNSARDNNNHETTNLIGQQEEHSHDSNDNNTNQSLVNNNTNNENNHQQQIDGNNNNNNNEDVDNKQVVVPPESPSSTILVVDNSAVSSPSTPQQQQPNSVATLSQPQPKERRKTVVARKKRRGFFRTLGYEKLNTPITILCVLGTLALAIAVAIKQAVRPTLMYCANPTQVCDMPQEFKILDIVFLAVGGVIDLVLLVLSISIVMAPGALMDSPRRNKILTMCMSVVLLWTMILLIGPVAMRRQFIIPYGRVQPTATATIVSSNSLPIVNGSQPAPSDTPPAAVYTLDNFFHPVLQQAQHKKLLVRVYRAISPSSDSDQYAPASHYYSYSDELVDSMYYTLSIYMKKTCLTNKQYYMFVLYSD